MRLAPIAAVLVVLTLVRLAGRWLWRTTSEIYGQVRTLGLRGGAGAP